MKSQVFICIISSGAASRFAGVMFVTTAGQIFKIFIQFVTYKWFHAIVAVAGSMHLWHLRTNVKALMQMRQKWEEKWRCHHTSCLFRFSATKLHSRVLSSQLLLFFWLSSFWFQLNHWMPRTLIFFNCPFSGASLFTNSRARSNGWRTFQPRTFQPQASTPDLSTPDYSTMNFPTLVEKSGVEKFIVGKSRVEKFMVEKSGVERSGVEAWGWKSRVTSLLLVITDFQTFRHPWRYIVKYLHR